ncbi:hypothetical protein [Spongiactinospora sp. 9N601]|uniref:hypothetical protein n=1 Tax=Spongiactinospora sp. 9N601 TaxID=3375149 RepID=UPI00378A9B38
MALQVLPLAVTMVAGPQIMSAIILLTHRQVVRVPLAYLAGVTIATVAGVALARRIAALLSGVLPLGDPADGGCRCWATWPSGGG